MLKRIRLSLTNRLRRAAYPAVQALSSRWPAYSRLFLVGDSAAWVLNEENRALEKIARQADIQVGNSMWLPAVRQQAVFYGGHFFLNETSWLEGAHRIGTSYYHGRPGEGETAFDQVYESLCYHHTRLARVHVSHSEMQQIVLQSGIEPGKVFLIPIGINLSYFAPQTAESRQKVRARLGIPSSAVVVGSFQKDGVGWGNGSEPKLIKGPDTFLHTVERLHKHIPELAVLLSGPARGYVKAGLERLGIPYWHAYPKAYQEVGQLFHALDLYLVTSRQEGGPKAILEAMASRVPLVTTRVGQAMDLVQHERNAWMADVEDVDGLAFWGERVLVHPETTQVVLEHGLQTAQAHSYEALAPRWLDFLRGIVEW